MNQLLKRSLCLFSGVAFILALQSCAQSDDSSGTNPTSDSQSQQGSVPSEPVIENSESQVFGKIARFELQVGNEKTKRSVLYYFPENLSASIQKGQKVKAVFFLHGGGETTANPEGATRVALRYLNSYLKYADTRDVALVFPTTSVGWNFQTRFYLRDLKQAMTQKFGVDENDILLAGHSMGGMGITREFAYVHSFFKGVLAQAAGARESSRADFLLRSYFITPYIHINGINDHFTDFEPWMRALERKLHLLEVDQGKLSRFELIFHKGDHQPNEALNFDALDRLFLGVKPGSLNETYGIFAAYNYPETKMNPGVVQQALDQVHWIRAKDYVFPDLEQMAKIRTVYGVVEEGKNIRITLESPNPKTCLDVPTVEISSLDRLIPSKRAIRIYINGQKVYSKFRSIKKSVTVKVPKSARC